MGVIFREKSSSGIKILTLKPYRTNDFGGPSAPFSGTVRFGPKIEPKLQHFFEALELHLSRFQSLTGITGNQMRSDSKSIKPAFEVISSYIYIYIYIYLRLWGARAKGGTTIWIRPEQQH